MLTFQSGSILQKSQWSEKVWTFAELLESPAPLDWEPLADRTAAMQKIAGQAGQIAGELSKTAGCGLS